MSDSVCLHNAFRVHSSSGLRGALLDSREDRREDGHLGSGVTHCSVRSVLHSGGSESRGGRTRGSTRGPLLLPHAAHARHAVRVLCAECGGFVSLAAASAAPKRTQRRTRALHCGGPHAHDPHALRGPFPDPRQHAAERRTTKPDRCCLERCNDVLAMYAHTSV